MKKEQVTDKIHTSNSEYDSLITTETTTSETHEDIIEMLKGMSGGIERDLSKDQELAEKLIKDSGHDPKDYLSLLKHRRHSPEWFGAKILFYLKSSRQHIANGNAEDAVFCALRMAWVETLHIIKHWEIDARVGRKQREVGTSQGGNTQAYSPSQRRDWQRRANVLFAKHPRYTKINVAEIINQNLEDEGLDKIPLNTLRQRIHK